jgi:hypothetical protein
MASPQTTKRPTRVHAAGESSSALRPLGLRRCGPISFPLHARRRRSRAVIFQTLP